MINQLIKNVMDRNHKIKEPSEEGYGQDDGKTTQNKTGVEGSYRIGMVAAVLLEA